MNNIKYIVYCTMCTENGKIYIGVHKTKTPEEFDGYIGNGIKINWNIKNPHTAFQYALKKYGYSKFKRSTLFIFDSAQEAYAKEAEIVTLEFVKRRDNYNTCLGGIQSGTCFKSIYQYKLDGTFVKEWFSITEAENYFGCCKGRLSTAVKNKWAACNYYWSFDQKDILNIENYTVNHMQETYCYDLTGQLIGIYKTTKEAALALDLSPTSVLDASSHKHPVKGYYFVKGNVNIIELIKKRELVFSLTDKSVSNYNKNGSVIHTYPNLKSAARANNISVQEIKESIKAQDGVWNYGYSVKYSPKLQPTGLKINMYDLNGKFIKTWPSVAQCAKEHPKVREVLHGERKQTHGYTFKIVE